MAKSGKAGIAEDEIQAKGEDDIDAGDNQDVEEILHLTKAQQFFIASPLSCR